MTTEVISVQSNDIDYNCNFSIRKSFLSFPVSLPININGIAHHVITFKICCMTKNDYLAVLDL